MSQCPHINLADPDSYIGGVPFEWLRELREKEPVFWQVEPQFAEGGYWAITKHKDLDYVSKNPAIFSSAERTCLMKDMAPEQLELNRMILINMDPPDHIKHRRIVRNAFTPKVVDSYHERFKVIAKHIIDQIADQGRCEFVQDVAAELPLIAICELMAVPLDRRKDVFEWTNIMIGSEDPDLSTSEEDGQMAMAELFALGHQLATDYLEGKAVAENTGYLMSALLDGIEGEKLNEVEFSTFFLILLVAGNETTRTVTAQGMRLLMEHPDALQQLIDKPDLIPDAIEEMLRYHTAVVSFRRTVMEDAQLPSGHTVKKGDNVVLFYHSASRDEEVFDDPDTFDITRAQREDVRNKHRAFGIGEHFCLGSHLARLELQVIFEEIIPRLRNPRLAQPVSWLRSNFINGIKEMHIEFDAN